MFCDNRMIDYSIAKNFHLRKIVQIMILKLFEDTFPNSSIILFLITSSNSNSHSYSI